MRTTLNNGLMRCKTPKPVLQPAMQDTGQVWTALAEIGRQLQLLAAAQTGHGNLAPTANTPPPSPECDTTVAQLASLFLTAKARAGKSDAYLAQMHYTLDSFILGRAHRPAASVTVAELEKWIDRRDWAARTRKGKITDVRTLYNFGIRRGLVRHNPANGVELPVCDTAPVEIHTPEQVRAVLDFARGYDLRICRALAVRYFTGLRTAEIERVEEKDIGEKYIEVTARNAKTRRRRLVTIQPNLRAWLALGGELPARPANGRAMFEFMASLVSHTGAPWPHNVTRHSFCSYHLAAFQNAGQTALQAGHSEAMLFHHYREVVSPEASAEFWAIVP